MSKLDSFAASLSRKALVAALLCASAFASAQGAVTYTWTGRAEPNADGSLNWSNPTNWGKTAATDYPGKATSDIAAFPASTTAKIRIDVSKKIASITATASGLDLTFVKDEGCVLTLTGAFACGTQNSKTESGSVFTLDGAEIVSAGTSYIDTTAKLILKNAASLKVSVLRMDSKYAYKEGLVELSGGSTLTVTKTGNTAFCINDGGRLVIDDSTVDIKGYTYLNNQNLGGGRIVFKGAKPKLLVSGATFRAENTAGRTKGMDFDFLVPAEGWAEAPIQHLGTTQAFLDGAPNNTTKVRFNVLPESPVFTSGLTADIPLVSAAAGMKISEAEFTALRYAPSNDIHVSDDTTAVALHVETTDNIVRVGTTKTESCGFPGPYYGYNTVTPGQMTFAFTNAAYAVGSTAVTGARVYAVDPDTGARTEIEGSPFAGDAFTCAVGAGMLDVIWEYDWISAFGNTIYVTPDGDDANDGLTWETAKATLLAAVTAAADGTGIVLGDGMIVEKDGSELNRPLTVTSVNGATHTTLYLAGCTKRLVKLNNADAILRNVTLASDFKETSYGAISIYAGLVEDCVVRDFNTPLSKLSGVGAYLEGGIVRRCLFTHDLLHTSGGSGCGSVIKMKNGLVENCEIVDNPTSGGGSSTSAGAVNIEGGTLRNCLIARNTDNGRTPGLYATRKVAKVPTTIENCTIVSNSCISTTTCGGVCIEANVTVRNCVFAGNMNSQGERNFTSAGGTFSHCCAVEELAGDSNYQTPPEFVDFDAGDYRIASGVCIDGGDDQDWMTDATDLGGTKRILGDHVDIGCYEFVEKELTCSVLPSATYGLNELEVEFMATVKGVDRTGLTYSWSLVDGTSFEIVDSTDSTVKHTYTPGKYSVRLVVKNASGERAEAFYENLIVVAPNIVYVSKTSTPQVPYATPETAAATIADAMSVAGAGVRVVVDDGTYPLTERIVINDAITLESIGGRDRTFIVRESKDVGRMMDVNNADAVIRGFTFTQSQPGEAVGGTGFELQKGTIESCTVSNLWGDGTVCYAANGVISNVIVTCCRSPNRCSILHVNNDTLLVNSQSTRNNSATGDYGGGICVTAGSPTIRGCLIAFNTNTLNTAGISIYANNALLIENCTVVSNVVTGSATVKVGEVVYDLPAGIEDCPDRMAASKVRIVNSIIRGNLNKAGKEFNTEAKGVFTTSCTAYPEVEGMVSADPMFFNPARGEFRLREASPAVDAGTNQTWMVGAKDLKGNPRIYGAESGGIVDMGCFERIPVGLMLMVR